MQGLRSLGGSRLLRDSAIVRLFWPLTAAALSIFVLYAPQPLLPLFASLYGLREAEAGLLMTATMLPLALAPLSYGFLLGFVRPIQVLRVSLLLLAIATWATGLSGSFNQLLFIRFLHGLLIPASLTAVMAFLAGSVKEADSLQSAMSLYVTATVSGGFIGRLLAGVSTDFLDWPRFFYGLAALLVVCCMMIRTEETGRLGEKQRETIPWTGAYHLVRLYVPVYLSVFCLFFVFSGTLNYLPFRIVELTGSRSGIVTGIMYCGYITGIVTSLAAGKIVRQAGSDVKVMLAGFIIFLATLAAMINAPVVFLFALVFPFCGAMFLVHSIASATVNRNAGHRSGLASGIYVSSYYGGGVLGTYLPGLVYEWSGWGRMVLALVAFGCIGVVLLTVFHRVSGAAEQ